MNKYCLATIVNHEEITSGIWKMELAASEIARIAGPGQFIMLYPPDKRNLLARPISLSAISEKSVTIVYKILSLTVTKQKNRCTLDFTWVRRFFVSFQ